MFDTFLDMVENGVLKVDNDFWGYKSIDRGIEDLCCKTYCDKNKIQVKLCLFMNHDITRLSVENP